MRKKKTGLDYVKAYNKKIKNSKSKLTYIPIDIEAFQELTPSEKGQVTKQIKNFDLRREIKAIGANISVKTRNLIKTLEKFANKRVQEFRSLYENLKLKQGGKEIPPQSKVFYEKERPQVTNIDVSRMTPKEIEIKAKSFQNHFKKDFYNKRTEAMKQNYIDSLLLTFGAYGKPERDVEGLLKYMNEMDTNEFYRTYLENIDMTIVFDISPATRKKTIIEFPRPDNDILYDSVAIGSGYAKSVRNELMEELSDFVDEKDRDLINDINNSDIRFFWEAYNGGEFDYTTKDDVYSRIKKYLKDYQKYEDETKKN